MNTEEIYLSADTDTADVGSEGERLSKISKNTTRLFIDDNDYYCYIVWVITQYDLLYEVMQKAHLDLYRYMHLCRNTTDN